MTRFAWLAAALTLFLAASPVRAQDQDQDEDAAAPAAAGVSSPTALTWWGAGLRLGSDNDGSLKVRAVAPGSPAEFQGLKPDDVVAAVAQGDGAFVKVGGADLNGAVDMIRGAKGTAVRLRVAPAEDPSTEQEFTLERTMEISATDQLEQRKDALRAAAGLVRRCSEDGYDDCGKGLRAAMAARAPLAATAWATRSGALGSIHKTLAALEYADALRLGAPADSTQEIAEALKSLLADPDLAIDSGTLDEWNGLADEPPPPNAVDELGRQALSHYHTGLYDASLASAFSPEESPGADDNGAQDDGDSQKSGQE